MKSVTSSASIELTAEAMQKYQYVYNVVTEKSEKKSTYKFDSHRIDFNCIANLHASLEQTLSTWGCMVSNVSVTQRLSDGSSERWSSFEKFRIHSGALLHETSDVEIVYNLLIKLPNGEKPSPYKITVGLRNALFDLTSIRSDDNETSFEIYVFSKTATARWEIEFVDISVARAIDSAIASWYQAVPKERKRLHEKIIKSTIDYVPAIVRITSAIIVYFSVVGFGVSAALAVNISDIFSFVLILYLVHAIATPLISRLTKSLKMLRSAASILITKKDGELYEREKGERTKNAFWVVVNLILPHIPAFLGYVMTLTKQNG